MLFRSDHELIQTMLLRSMSQAVYSADNIGHFGLALEEYAHFSLGASGFLQAIKQNADSKKINFLIIVNYK